jgi:hypothetical protein
MPFGSILEENGTHIPKHLAYTVDAIVDPTFADVPASCSTSAQTLCSSRHRNSHMID